MVNEPSGGLSSLLKFEAFWLPVKVFGSCLQLKLLSLLETIVYILDSRNEHIEFHDVQNSMNFILFYEKFEIRNC